MPIIDLQARARELGRIRIGVQVPTSGGKTRPEKLDRFRVTSASQTLIKRVAQLYGGDAKPWDNHGTAQWEVITTSMRLPILLPPQPISQYYELWSGGGCQRRCDGQTELLKDKPCLCDPDPTKRKCKPTTRLNVILRDVEGIGVFRLESHGYYAAIELPDVAMFVARGGSYVSAWLSLEQRTALREGKTLRWIVPTIEVDVTPAQLMAGHIAPELEQAPAAVTAGSGHPLDLLVQWVNDVKDATSVDGLRDLWRLRPMEKLPEEAEQIFTVKAARLRKQEEEKAVAPVGMDQLSEVDALWMEALGAAPAEWSTEDLEKHFTELTGVNPVVAVVADLRKYFELVKAGDSVPDLGGS
jgi:hypothetical protein